MTTEIKKQFGRFLFSFEIAKELWYITTDKGIVYQYFAITKFKLPKFNNQTGYNLVIGPIMIRAARINDENYFSNSLPSSN